MAFTLFLFLVLCVVLFLCHAKASPLYTFFRFSYRLDNIYSRLRIIYHRPAVIKPCIFRKQPDMHGAQFFSCRLRISLPDLHQIGISLKCKHLGAARQFRLQPRLVRPCPHHSLYKFIQA